MPVAKTAGQMDAHQRVTPIHSQVNVKNRLDVKVTFLSITEVTSETSTLGGMSPPLRVPSAFRAH